MADGKIIIDTKVDNSGIELGVKKIDNSLSDTAKKAINTFNKAVVGIGTALGGISGYAFKVGSDFEEGMSKVQAISGATGEEMLKLTDKAKEMGAKTKFSATESAEALQYMGMAGWKTQDMLDGLAGIMNLAAASGEELGLTSDIVTDALTAFGMKANESAHFADVLAQASSASNTNVAMLGESFKYVAPLAGSLGYSAEDTSIALGLMANAGIKSSQAGTTLKTALVNMAKPTGDMAEIMDKYNISLTNSDGSMKSLHEVMNTLREKMGGLDKATQSATMAQLFGKESLAGMLAVINASPEDYEKLTNAIYNCDGASQQMADTMNNNLKGDFTILKSALEGLGIELYNSFSKPMRDIVKSANETVTQLIDVFKNEGAIGLVGAVGEIMANIITNMAQGAPKVINLSIEVINNFIKGIKDNLPQITQASIEIMTTLARGIIEMLPNILEMGIQMMIELGKGITGEIPNLIPLIFDLIIKIADTVTQNIDTIVNTGISIILALVKGIADSLPTLIEEVPRVINAFADTIFDQLPKILETGIKIIGTLIEGLIKSIPTLIENIPQIILAIVNVITLYNWSQLGKNVIEWLGNGIRSMKENIGSVASGIAEKVSNTITNIFKGGFSWGKNLISSMGEGFTSLSGFIKDSASSIGSGVLNTFKNIFSGGFDIGKNLITGIWNGISNMKQWILDKIGGFAGNIISGIKDVFDIHSPSRVMRDEVGRMLPRGIVVGVEKEQRSTENHIDNFMGDMVGRMKANVKDTMFSTGYTVATQGSHTENNYGGITQNVTIVNPERTPSENARALLKVSRGLDFVY